MSKRKQEFEFVAHLAKELSTRPAHVVAKLAADLIGPAITHGAAWLELCNGPEYRGRYFLEHQDEWRADIDRRVNRARAKIEKLCADCPEIEPIFSTDPRGATVRLKLASRAHNDWLGEAVVVPGA